MIESPKTAEEYDLIWFLYMAIGNTLISFELFEFQLYLLYI